MWDAPEPGIEPVSPALAGRFSTTEPPGSLPLYFLIWQSTTNVMISEVLKYLLNDELMQFLHMIFIFQK